MIAHAELIPQSQGAAGGLHIGVVAPAFLVVDGLHLARGTYLAVFDTVHVVLFIGNHSAGFDGFAQLGAGCCVNKFNRVAILEADDLRQVEVVVGDAFQGSKTPHPQNFQVFEWWAAVERQRSAGRLE